MPQFLLFSFIFVRPGLATTEVSEALLESGGEIECIITTCIVLLGADGRPLTEIITLRRIRWLEHVLRICPSTAFS